MPTPVGSTDALGRAVPRLARRYYRQLQFILDGAVLGFAFLLAYVLRFDFRLDGAVIQDMAPKAPFVVLVQFSTLMLVGAHRRVWRYTSLQDIPVFLRAAFYSTALILLVRLSPFQSLQPVRVPLSIIVMDATFAFGGLVALRALRRGLDERLTRTHRNGNGPARPTDCVPVIFVGAGRAGVLAVREIGARDDAGICPVAFVDDDPLKQHSVIGGVPVKGTTEDLPELVAELGVDHVVLTMAQVPREQKRRIVGICREIPVRVREIPGYFEVLQGSVSFSRIRDVDVEELLGREPIHLDEAHLRAFLRDKRVLVTGAGGSIGSELARQIVKCAPAQLVLLERAEHALFQIGRELAGTGGGVDVQQVLADCGDVARVRKVFGRCRPQVVVHAAAHKHVPMMEWHPTEAIKNNVMGTYNLATIAGEAGAESFILVSTDKAVRPSSVMGASKRVAELVIQEMDRRYPTVFSAVRFGNVLGSAGSVIPIFRQQIAEGGPLTVTDPEMQRYFMSIPEAAQLVLRAGSLAAGGEIFVLNMGEPIKIRELAENMIRLSGFEPGRDIEILITGRRRGEKLFEELGSDAEGLTQTVSQKILMGRLQPYPSDRLEAGLARLRELAEAGAGEEIRAYLGEFLPEARLDLDGAILQPRAMTE